jgi:hypothetical protein
VGAGFAPFLQDAYRNLFALFFCELLEPDGGREPSWTGTDNHDVIVHAFARAVLFEEGGILAWIHGALDLVG